MEIGGRRYEVGGLIGQPNYAFLRPEWLDHMRADPAAFQLVGFEVGKPTERLAWRRVRHHAPGAVWPPAGVALRLDFGGPVHQPAAESPGGAGVAPVLDRVRVSVHYQMYDGIPCYCKWITVSNDTDQSLRIDEFYHQSGFHLLEHDGSYTGDFCASEQHPGHRGLLDSRRTQWRTIADFYRWCRAQGIYLNVPDHYFLAGSSKTGMGYREVNWSLPRDQQVIHTRQNIFDGTWEKTPSMGWMFVPLTEYQGGGAAATIEPLDEHLDHYERLLVNNLACGVQACYRGPRLYDTPRTRTMVERWMRWFKTHRDILESDLIHGLRADARDVDWMLHVNPGLEEKGLLVAFNPLERPVQQVLHVNVYYTGLADVARVISPEGAETTLKIGRDYTVDVPVEIPAQGMTWCVIKSP